MTLPKMERQALKEYITKGSYRVSEFIATCIQPINNANLTSEGLNTKTQSRVSWPCSVAVNKPSSFPLHSPWIINNA